MSYLEDRAWCGALTSPAGVICAFALDLLPQYLELCQPKDICDALLAVGKVSHPPFNLLQATVRFYAQHNNTGGWLAEPVSVSNSSGVCVWLASSPSG